MSFDNPLLARLAGGGRIAGNFCVSTSAMAAEALVVEGIDFVAIDMQHGSPEMVDLRAMVTAIENRGVPAVARVAVNDPTLIGRALDLGALGVIVPMVEDAAATARAVASTRYGPAGVRSYGPSHFGLRHGTWDHRDAERVAVFVMVETATGLANARAIAATPGLHGIVIGPSDLAISLGHDASAPHSTPDVVAAIRVIRDACLEAGTAPGIICPDADLAVRYLRDGFRIVTVSSDIGLIMDGLAGQAARLREALGRAGS